MVVIRGSAHIDEFLEVRVGGAHVGVTNAIGFPVSTVKITQRDRKVVAVGDHSRPKPRSAQPGAGGQRA
jgi:hypothetical protein